MDSGMAMSIVEDLYESTSLYIYQFPGDDSHLLAFCVPDSSNPSIICVTAIHMGSTSCYVLEPGNITYSVVGWGHRSKHFDEKDKQGIEEYLTPGLVMFNKSTQRCWTLRRFW
jgi:hypothetical protein